jgi:hypothetical protein
MTIIPLAPPSLAKSSNLPGDSADGPSAAACAAGLPIWSCSVRGFACHRCCHRRGALLPHLFTLTPPSLSACASSDGAAVCFLCHCPSGHPDRALPGALPCGVRTFLPAFARQNLTSYGEVTISPLGPALLAGSSDLPGGFGRAVLKRLPIWPCSVRGFACHLPCGRCGALLPHLFTLTRLRGCAASAKLAPHVRVSTTPRRLALAGLPRRSHA